ncbi:Pycsar system effector family protein [Geobacter anodireducens]
MSEKNNEPKNPASDYSLSSRVDLLVKIINRYDTYIVSTNTKASLFIAWNGIVIGSILLKYQEILEQFSCMNRLSAIVPVLLVFCGLFALLSTGLIFGVVFPFLTPSREGKASLIFFGSVADMKTDEYVNAMQSVSVDNLIVDLAGQASVLAFGLNKKMKRLQRGIWAIYAELTIIAILLILYVLK